MELGLSLAQRARLLEILNVSIGVKKFSMFFLPEITSPSSFADRILDLEPKQNP